VLDSTKSHCECGARLFSRLVADAPIATFKATEGLTAEESAGRMIAVAERRAESQEDDLTVLVCDYLGAG
jgi:hypothetical protein